ncbi:MAG: hypothetical protein QXY86_03085 [Candidatus Micrarchaeaceae archaeon]
METEAWFNPKTDYGFYVHRVLIPNELIDIKEKMIVRITNSATSYIIIEKDPRGFLEISAGGIKGERNFLEAVKIVDKLAKDYKELFLALRIES